MEISIFLAIFLSVFSLSNSHPTATALNPQPLQNNGLSEGSSVNSNNQMGHSGASLDPNNSVGQFVFRAIPSGQPGSTYMQNFQSGYARDHASPFFGLSSTGEFQLSAYFSQIFWGTVILVISVAVVIWLIRILLPNEELDNLVKKIKSTKAGKAMDLDGLTNLVYGAIDTYGKWALKDTRNAVTRPKRR